MSTPTKPRRATNVTLPETLLREARALGVNVSQACEQGLAAKLKEARAEAWLRENADAIAAYNAYVDEHGMPLAEFRPVYE
jgi:antitoxin CcdA